MASSSLAYNMPPPLKKIIEAVHCGLNDAWLFAFRATGTPGARPKPEYVATVTVAEKIISAVHESGGINVLLEENVQKIAGACLASPAAPLPRPRPRIPARKIDSTGDRERVDIAIYDNKVGLLPVARALVELKICNSAAGLRADLTRNQQFMKLTCSGRQNQLDAALLGFVVVDKQSVGKLAGRKVLEKLAKRYKKMAQPFLSTDYLIEVSARQVSLPPEEEDDEFVHIVSIVITFARVAKCSVLMPNSETRFLPTSSSPAIVALDMPEQ